MLHSINIIILYNQILHTYAFAPGKPLGRFSRLTVFKGNVHGRALKFFRAVRLGLFYSADQHSQTAGRSQYGYIGKGNPGIL